MTLFKSLIAATLLTVIAGGGPVLAHAHLGALVPNADSTVASPEQIQVTFTEPLNLRLSTAMLMDAAGAHIATGAPVLLADGMTLVLPVTKPLASGKYQVMWNILSVDGHKTKGSYSFSVR
ncbi:MAG TPA: copper homeostasis periplasmic binding protein CopC [Paenirhodobacter sp.]